MNKKLLSAVLAVGITFGTIGIVEALSINTGGLGGQVEKHGKKAATKAIVSDYNKKLKKKACTYSDATTVVPNCNLDKITSDLSAFHDAMEGTIARDIDVIINTQGPTRTIAWKRAEYIRDHIRSKVSWYDWRINYREGRANEAVIQLSGR